MVLNTISNDPITVKMTKLAFINEVNDNIFLDI